MVILPTPYMSLAVVKFLTSGTCPDRGNPLWTMCTWTLQGRSLNRHARLVPGRGRGRKQPGPSNGFTMFCHGFTYIQYWNKAGLVVGLGTRHRMYGTAQVY